MDANTKFDIFCDQISQFTSYHVPRRKLSKPEIKLSAKPWITKHILAKYDIEINSIPKSLGINHSNPILIYLHKNISSQEFIIVLSKILKRASLIILRITFCAIRIIWKKSGLELDQSSTLVKLKLMTFPYFRKWKNCWQSLYHC